MGSQNSFRMEHTAQLLRKHATPQNREAFSTQAKKKVHAKKKVASPFKQVHDFMAQDGSSLTQ